MIFKTGYGIIQTGNGIISPTSRPLIRKLLLQHFLYIYQGIQNWFSIQEMELSKPEMDLFLPLLGLWSKNFFCKIFLISIKKFKIDFHNRKWNYPNRIGNYFSHIKASDQKASVSKYSSFSPRVQNWFSKQEMELPKQEMKLSKQAME